MIRKGPAATAVVVLVLTAVSGCTVGSDAPAAGTDPVPISISRADAARLETALSSADPTTQRQVVASLAQPGTPQPNGFLPAGSTVHVDESRAVSGDDLGTGAVAEVPATVSGPQPGSWTLLLVREGDRWQLFGTAPA